MRAADLYEEIKEVTGNCDLSVNLRAITRAVELLSNEGLFDPLIGYLNFTVDGAYYVALPREVKTVLRVNIDRNPTFFRNRLFEFTLNTDGSNDGEEVGYAWHDRGYLPIQDERKLPGNLSYKCSSADDDGKTVRVIGKDENGRDIDEILIASDTAPVPGEKQFFEVTQVIRDATAGECFLLCNGVDVIAQYYGNETEPTYRVLKLSKTGVAVRIMYRREVFAVRSLQDVLPLHSSMAVIHAAKAVRLMGEGNYDEATKALGFAVDFIKKEQASRDEHNSIASDTEQASAIDASITTRDSIIVRDVYDVASEIFGPIGRRKLFDKITTAIEVLRNKAEWDASTGVADVWLDDRSARVNVQGSRGNGYFVLPRFVESVISLNYCGTPAMPGNRWFEFHMNGWGESNTAHCGTWEDAGETCILNWHPIDPDTRKPVAVKVIAVPNNPMDDGKRVVIYGRERLGDGREVEVWRNGRRGWLCPCSYSDRDAGDDAPAFTHFERIERDETIDFVRLIGYEGDGSNIALIGDMGRADDQSAAVASMIAARSPSEVILLGDDNYSYTVGYVRKGQSTDFSAATITIAVALDTQNNGFSVGDKVSIGSTPYLRNVTAVTVEANGFMNVITLDDLVPVNPGDAIKRYSAVTSWGSTIDAVLGVNYGAFKAAGHLWSVPGNHDWGNVASYPQGLDDYLAYFNQPGNGRYFSKVFGEVEVFFLSSDNNEPDGNTVGSVQHQWFEAAVAASAARWKVVVVHHAPKTSGTGHGPKTALQWNFAELGIHAVVAGHNHVYERWEEGGVLYFTCGVGSNDLVGFVSSPSPYSKKRLAVNGSMFMQATSQHLRFTFRNTSGVVLDRREIAAPVGNEILLGFWYPDEVEPKYKVIKTSSIKSKRIRILYRKRFQKITSLLEPIPLRSRIAIENMLRGLKAQETDLATALAYETAAVDYLSEERINSAPSDTPSLQFDTATMPGFAGNIT